MAQMTHNLDDSISDDRKFLLMQVWRDIFQLVLLVATFCAVLFVRPAPRYELGPLQLSTVFVALATLCLGFGAGMLVYRRRQHADAVMLRREYAELGSRAQALGHKMDDLIERKQRPGF